MEKELPKNWVECTLNDLALIQSGGTPSRAMKSYWDGNIPWVKISDIKDLYVNETTEFITEEGLANSAARIFPKGTILFTIFATIGRIGILNIDATTNQAIAGITPTKLINHKYITYSLIDLSNSISEFGKGVAQKNINQAILKDTIVPLPPLSEQNRIVAKLDSLFAQLETIKTSMAKIPVLLKNFRQQVLTQAVTGKLTEEWKEGKSLEKWRTDIIKNLATKMGSGSTPRGGNDSYIAEGIPLVRSMNVVFGGIKLKGLAFINEEQAQALKNVEIFFEDILLNITGASIGRLCLADENVIGGRINQHVFIIRAKKEIILPKYLEVYLSSSLIQKIIDDIKYGAGMEAISKTQIERMEINFPSMTEQQEIVSRVKSLVAKADAIEEKYKNLKAKIETLPQAILHKAFKGELTEQLETDGDAKVLLAEIVALKNEGKKEKVCPKKYVQPDEEGLRIVAEESPSCPTLSARDKKVQRKMLATHIINQSLEDKSFGKTKFEKLLHLVEYHVLQKDLNQNYSVQAAGPYDGTFTKIFWDEVLKSKWFAIEEHGNLRRIVGGEKNEKSLKDYGYFSDEQKEKISNLIEVFKSYSYQEPEIISTLYAVWNNRLIRKEPITDDLLKEDFLNWDSGKAKYANRLDKALEWMREKGIVPNGWGKEISRAKRK